MSNSSFVLHNSIKAVFFKKSALFLTAADIRKIIFSDMDCSRTYAPALLYII